MSVTNTQYKINMLLGLLVLPLVILVAMHFYLPGNYIVSSLYKFIFITPLLLRPLFYKSTLRKAFLEHIDIKKFAANARKAFMVGLGLAFIYILHYLLFRSMISPDIIVEQLDNTASITATNIILIGVYIIIANSFLEEFFWRGFAFNELEKLITPWKAHLVTGIAFSLHHVIFYYGWFDIFVFILVTLGLVLYAVFMNMFFKRYQDLLSCWLIHAMVDIVQIYIALSIFSII